MARFTPAQFATRLRTIANDETSLGAAMFLAVKSTQSEMGERIFENGNSTNGSSIGKYGKNPLYVDDQNSPIAGNHKGKPNKDGKKKDIKTTYYESYQAFRSKQGRQSGFVNLRLFGRLQSDFLNAPVKKGNYKYSITVSAESINKIKGNEKRFGKKIFGLSLSEKETFRRVLKFEIVKLIRSNR